MICKLCPRECGFDRKNDIGACGASDKAVVAKTMLHHWEEPVISGDCGEGSGAIFFSGCSLRCVYCQNYKISRAMVGQALTPEQLAERMRILEEKGAININLVTPTHFVREILEALKIYRPKVPIVWNTSGYEKPETIRALKNVVDVYLTDFKYHSPALADEYSAAPDYFDYASRALIEMRKNQPRDVIVDGKMVKGVLVRHLVLPSTFHDSLLILDHIKETLGEDTYISLMNQYTPTEQVADHPLLSRRVRPLEYKIVVEHARALGFHNGFIQDPESQTLDYTPDFPDQI